ncbi:MAG: DUF357 domain-containing protein [Candidatus Micrarchaeota archaeon]
MEAKERAAKDIAKLERIMGQFRKLGLESKYPQAYEYARNYWMDARHFFENGDYFSAFGAANYAYGYIDCVLLLEGKKDDIIL